MPGPQRDTIDPLNCDRYTTSKVPGEKRCGRGRRSKPSTERVKAPAIRIILVTGPDHMLTCRAGLPDAGGHPAVGTTYAQGLATSNRQGPETVCLALDRTDSMRSPEQ